MRRAIKPLILFVIGGLSYILLEFLWRGHSHWTMFLVGGVCGYFVGLINEIIPWDTPLWKQSIIGAAIVTAIEFVSGCIINLWFKWNVWDYSNLPFNIMGQVCLYYFFLWIPVTTVWIIADDYQRYWIFNEEKPRYRLF